MNIHKLPATLRMQALVLFSVIFVAGCGGGSSAEPDAAPVTVLPSTGTVGLLFTDAPTDDFESILLTVTEATLIGGDDKQTFLFQGAEPIDLLNLTNFSEPIVFGEVSVGNYTKLRLKISDLELVLKNDGGSIFPSLPANGKIDLLQAGGFDVLPGRTLLLEIDMDANKSIKITGAGNSGKYKFRPVVKVNVMDGGMQHKLARLEGSVDEILTDQDGNFILCDIDSPEHCVTVSTNGDTGIFDDLGLDTPFSTLAGGNMVVVIGTYETEPEIVLNAIVLEIGGNAVQIKGNVVSNPMDDQFLMVLDDNGDLVVELQAGTKFYDPDGVITRDAIVVGVDVEIEGVQPPKDDEADPDLIRAALVFLEEDPDEQISGSITLDTVNTTEPESFDLVLEDASTICVRLGDNAEVLLVDEANSQVTTTNTLADLVALGLTEDPLADVFGVPDVDSCFEANEVIVAIEAAP